MAFDPVIEDNPNLDLKFPPSMHSISFKSCNKKLIGSIFMANGEGPHPTVALLHGFPGNEMNFDLAHALRRSGYNVFIFHYRGAWGSEGNFSFSNSIEDVKSAYDFLKSEEAKNYRIDNTKLVFIGHSMGGFVTLMNTEYLKDVKNIGFIGGFNFGGFADLIISDENVRNYVLDHLQFGVDMVRGTSEEELLNEMIENRINWNLLNKIDQLKNLNILMVAAEYDSTALPNLHHIPIVSQLKGKNLEEHILESGHVFSNKRIELIRIVVNWVRKLNL